MSMGKIEHIQKSIEDLTPQEVEHLRAWLEEFEARRFDDALEQDAKAGKLEKIADRVRVNIKSGRGEEF